jgi:hypothetical protein
MIWTDERKARKEYPCDYNIEFFEPCPDGVIKKGERYHFSTASPGDEHAGNDVWNHVRLHLHHYGGTNDE